MNTTVLPRVTDIIRAVLPNEPTCAGDWHLRRGQMLHKAIALALRGRLDRASVDERILPRLEAAEKAVRELGLRPDRAQIESTLVHPTLRYQGTPDYIEEGTIVDWKSSVTAAAEPQLGAYALLCPEKTVKRLYAVELHDGGTYQVHSYKPDRAKRIWLAIYTLYGWQHGRSQNQGGNPQPQKEERQ